MDYESGIQSYNLIVRVSDQSNSILVNIACGVTPINDAPPVIVPGGVSTIREDLATGNIIGTVQASDADLPPHGISGYQFVGKIDGLMNSLITFMGCKKYLYYICIVFQAIHWFPDPSQWIVQRVFFV